MATHYKTRAFVFRKTDRNESDRVFSVFTDRYGRLDIFAKAIRKDVSKLRYGIDTFFMSEIEFIQGKNRKTLTDTLVTEKFTNIYQDLGKFKTANKIGDILDGFIRGEEKDKEIFSLLMETMKNLDSHSFNTVSQLMIYCYFFWSIASLLGYRPEVQKCNVCRGKLDPYYVYFSDKAGGTICKKCSASEDRAQKINSDVVKILRLIFKKEWKIISSLKVEQSSLKLLKEISDSYYEYTLSSRLLVV